MRAFAFRCVNNFNQVSVYCLHLVHEIQDLLVISRRAFTEGHALVPSSPETSPWPASSAKRALSIDLALPGYSASLLPPASLYSRLLH